MSRSLSRSPLEIGLALLGCAAAATFAGSAGLTVRVRPAADPGLAGVDVLLCEADGPRCTEAVTVDPKGLARFKSVPRGPFAIEVTQGICGIVRHQYDAAAAASKKPIDFLVPPWSKLRVVLVQAESAEVTRPLRVKEVTFALDPKPGEPDADRTKHIRHSESAPADRFDLCLQPGVRYAVGAEVPGFHLGSLTVEPIDAYRKRIVEMVLRPEADQAM